MAIVTIVTDSPEVLSVASMTLRGRGYEVREALGGMDALQAVQDAPVEVLITDARLPDTTGADLIQDVRRLRPGLPTVMLTGYTPAGTASRDTLGATVVLPKPFFPQQLLAAVEKARSARAKLAA